MDPASCILYLLFLMLSSFFAATETAYASVSKVRMRTLADKGNKKAIIASNKIESVQLRIANILKEKQTQQHQLQINAAWSEHNRIVRGNPVRVYSGMKFSRKI